MISTSEDHQWTEHTILFPDHTSSYIFIILKPLLWYYYWCKYWCLFLVCYAVRKWSIPACLATIYNIFNVFIFWCFHESSIRWATNYNMEVLGYCSVSILLNIDVLIGWLGQYANTHLPRLLCVKISGCDTFLF